MSLENPYIGIPKCQDCGWKLYTDLTDNCSCMGELTPERELKHKIAYNRARELQTMSDSNLQTPEPEVIKLFPDIPDPVPDPVPDSATNDGLVHDDPSVSLDPAVAVPEEFPLTDPQVIDAGTIPWSKIPIAEISPLVWFNYIKFEGTDSTVFNVSDGNGRALFHCCEEEVASFVVRALNVFVQAAYQTQTQA